ncbi:major facilitator superfamily domain-containing protein [Mrakia frigida]|uniref:major facilitator superfamily domain-containing protein n=1 Tax=Mrakia frigida TaxID=29902 RepID=UPI003FCC1DFC
MTPEPSFSERQGPIEEIDELPNPDPVSNRIWYRRIRLLFVFIAIAGNCLTAGGVTIFPLYSPAVASRFNLDQARVNNIFVGGTIGLYFSAAAIGSFADHYGPRKTSLLAAFLNLIGYTSFSYLLGSSPSHPPSFLNLPIHVLLAISYAWIGMGTVASYFASLNTSTLTFPSHPSIAIGTPLALFGLSSFFLSSIASLKIFDDGDAELNVVAFTGALIGLVGGWNVVAAVGMKVMPDREGMLILEEEERIAELPETPPSLSQVQRMLDEEEEGGAGGGVGLRDDESTPLLVRQKLKLVRGTTDLSLSHLMREKTFWGLGAAMFLIVGPAEMILGSVGSIITSLLTPVPSFGTTTTPLLLETLLTSASFFSPSPTRSPLQVRQTHVQIISIGNTISRLSVGLLADYLSAPKKPQPPPPSANTPPLSELVRQVEESKEEPYRRRIHLSKPHMLLITLVGLGTAYLFAAVGGLKDVDALWVLTSVVGWSYGTIFTLTPSLCAQIFGLKTFGRNFGILSILCATSSLLFTYLYAYLAHLHQLHQSPVGLPEDPSGPTRVCAGSGCFEGIMWMSVVATVLGGVVVAWLGRRWRGRA